MVTKSSQDGLRPGQDHLVVRRRAIFGLASHPPRCLLRANTTPKRHDSRALREPVGAPRSRNGRRATRNWLAAPVPWFGREVARPAGIPPWYSSRAAVTLRVRLGASVYLDRTTTAHSTQPPTLPSYGWTRSLRRSCPDAPWHPTSGRQVELHLGLGLAVAEVRAHQEALARCNPAASTGDGPIAPTADLPPHTLFSALFSSRAALLASFSLRRVPLAGCA